MWKRLTGEKIEEIEKTILSDIEAISIDDRNEIEFYVGADSQRADHKITFVTAIVMYRNGKGGNGYYLSESYRSMENRDRLWMETYKAVEVALWLNPLLAQYHIQIKEIHADLNNDAKYLSNSMVKTCLGYIQGMNLAGQIKPYAWAASSVANGKTK